MIHGTNKGKRFRPSSMLQVLIHVRISCCFYRSGILLILETSRVETISYPVYSTSKQDHLAMANTTYRSPRSER